MERNVQHAYCFEAELFFESSPVEEELQSKRDEIIDDKKGNGMRSHTSDSHTYTAHDVSCSVRFFIHEEKERGRRLYYE